LSLRLHNIPYAFHRPNFCYYVVRHLKVLIRFTQLFRIAATCNPFWSNAVYMRRTTHRMTLCHSRQINNEVSYIHVHVNTQFLTVPIPAGLQWLSSPIPRLPRYSRCPHPKQLSSICNKKAQLTLSNPRDVKACKNCSNSMCFVSFHRIPFPQIANA